MAFDASSFNSFVFMDITFINILVLFLSVAFLSVSYLYALFHKFYSFSSIVAGPREARNPNLDSDQWIEYYACVPRL